MRTDYRESNAVHQESIDVYEAFIASGGKVIKSGVTKPSSKGKLKLLSKDKLRSLSNAKDLVIAALTKYKSLNSEELVQATGYDRSVIFNVARKLEDKNLLTRIKGKTVKTLTVFNWVG